MSETNNIPLVLAALEEAYRNGVAAGARSTARMVRVLAQDPALEKITARSAMLIVADCIEAAIQTVINDIEPATPTAPTK